MSKRLADKVALTRSMAYDYGPHNIRVNTLCPGWVCTPMSEHEMDYLAEQKDISRDEAFKLVTTHLSLRRPAESEEIANCCLFLASAEASFVTGGGTGSRWRRGHCGCGHLGLCIELVHRGVNDSTDRSNDFSRFGQIKRLKSPLQTVYLLSPKCTRPRFLIETGYLKL